MMMLSVFWPGFLGLKALFIEKEWQERASSTFIIFSQKHISEA